MKYTEKQMDLFEVPKDYYIVHCISADFQMNPGLSMAIDKKYDVKNNLFDNYKGLRFIYPLCLTTDRVISLVTKANQDVETDRKDLAWCIYDMKRIMDSRGIKKIAMAKSCFDKTKWNEVKKILQDVFSDTDVEILVVYKGREK